MKYTAFLLLTLVSVNYITGLKTDDSETDTTLNGSTIEIPDYNTLPPMPSSTEDPETTTVITTTTPVTTTTNATTKPTTTTVTTPTTKPTTTTPPNSTTTSTTTVKPTTSTVPSTTKTPPTKSTTTEQPGPTPTPASNGRRFDGPSFFGGIVLASGLMAIGFVSWKFYKARTERNYHTL